MSEDIIKKCHINSKALRLVSMTWSITNWYCLLRRDSLVTACTVPWMKKVLKDRIKPFAVVVEESLKQVAHMLFSSAWCLPEKGFYHSVFGTSIDLKWATTTVGKLFQFWLGRAWRGPAAESRVCLLKPSEIDSDTSVSKGQSHSGPAEKEKTRHCPGAESWGWQPSQLGSIALTECCPLPVTSELGTKHEVTWGDHLLQWGMQWSRIIPLLTAKKCDLLSTC